MLDLLINAHSGWRYLVLLAIIVTLGYYLFSYLTKKSPGYDRQIDLFFSITIHIQIGLGLLLVLTEFVEGTFYSQLWGHVITMILLLPLTIFYSRYAKLTGVISPQRRRLLGISVPIIALVLIIGGLQAINVGLFGS